MTPPFSFSKRVYWPPPGSRRSRLFVSMQFSHSFPFGPITRISPMCEMSNIPTRSRTARCSSSMLEYMTGMFQPPNPTIRALSLRCSATSGDCLRAGFVDSLTILPRYVGSTREQPVPENSARAVQVQSSKFKFHIVLGGSKLGTLNSERRTPLRCPRALVFLHVSSIFGDAEQQGFQGD